MKVLIIAAAATIVLLAAWLLVLWQKLIRNNSERKFLGDQLAKLEPQLEQTRQALITAQQAEQLALQKLQQAEQYKQEWEQHRQEFEKAARNSVMAAGQELSSKLLTDHKREAEEVRVKIETKNQQLNEQFLKQFSGLTESVAAVREISLQSKKQSDILWRTMSAPASAGQLTEVALENLLRNLGLREGSDFSLQPTMTAGEGTGLRPDCVIYLPHDRLMLIDCKASKHQLALESAEGEAAQEKAREDFRLAMHKHLEMLSRKGYMSALSEDTLHRTGKRPQHQVINVMYIASDAAVEKLDTMDASFRDKMQKAGIIAVGPSGLQGLCTLATQQIAEARKAENQERIMHEIERLLGGFASAFGHLQKLGNSIESAARHFGGFAGSYNRSVAPKLRQLQKLGVKPEGKQVLPERLPVCEVRNVEDWLVIEGSDEDAPLPVSLEDNTQQVA